MCRTENQIFSHRRKMNRPRSRRHEFAPSELTCWEKVATSKWGAFHGVATTMLYLLSSIYDSARLRLRPWIVFVARKTNPL